MAYRDDLAAACAQEAALKAEIENQMEALTCVQALRKQLEAKARDEAKEDRVPRRRWGAVLLLVVVGVGAGAAIYRQRQPPPPALRANPIVVKPMAEWTIGKPHRTWGKNVSAADLIRSSTPVAAGTLRR